MTMIEQLKAILFDLTYAIDRYKQENMMDQLSLKVKEMIGATDVVFYMYNQWQSSKQVSYYASNYSSANSFMKQVTGDTFFKFFQ